MRLFRTLSLFLIGVNAANPIGSLPAKAVVEYALPAAAETHEILAVSDNLLLISQQTDGSLLKVALDKNGNPTGVRRYTVTTQWSGLHGLTMQKSSGNTTYVWATLQFDNEILQIDPNGDDIDQAPKILKTIPIPSPAAGPHGILENNGNLWAACKDSSHVVRISIENTDDHDVWAVSRRPIFIAVHPTSGDVYSGLDLSSKIWRYDGETEQEIVVPPEKGTTPVGLLAGADGNCWVVLLGNKTAGTGTFGRINADASIDWFTMSSALGKTAGLIHLAFYSQTPSQFWLLGSSTVCETCINAVFAVVIDQSKTGTAAPHIALQNTITLPTQMSWTHRMIYHKGSIYVTELTTSTLAHVSGAGVRGLNVSETWDQYADWGLGQKAPAIDYKAIA